jgi:hypothetical protein
MNKLNDFITLHLDLINLKIKEKKCRECLNKNCIPKANKTLQPRLKKLKEEIEKNINIVPNTNITTIKLFYDGF